MSIIRIYEKLIEEGFTGNAIGFNHKPDGSIEILAATTNFEVTSWFPYEQGFSPNPKLVNLMEYVDAEGIVREFKPYELLEALENCLDALTNSDIYENTQEYARKILNKYKGKL